MAAHAYKHTASQRRHTALLHFGHPMFESQLADFSRPHPPLSLPLHFLSSHCPIKLKTKQEHCPSHVKSV